jgi:DUF2927 family protein
MTLKESPNAPVAQLDRVPVSETGGHRFDSCQARHFFSIILLLFFNPCFADTQAKQAHWQTPSYIIDSFIEIALNNEYSTTISRLRKWQKPIYYSIVHRAADKELHQEIVELHLEHLSNITGVDISAVDDNKTANLTIIFSTEQQLEQELQHDFLLANQQQIGQLTRNSVCLAHFSTAADSSIDNAIVIIPVDRARAHAKLLSCVVEELTQIMGLPNDSDKVFPSIFNDKSHDDYLSGLDYLLLNLLYDERMPAGMNQSQIKQTLQQLVQEPSFRQQIEQAEQTVNQQGLFQLLNE